MFFSSKKEVEDKDSAISKGARLEDLHVDHLVSDYIEKEANLIALGKQLEESQRDIVVAFIDLCDSTGLKQELEPKAWLGHIYSFLTIIENICIQANGFMVKRIGDALMLTFKEASHAEQFLKLLDEDPHIRERFRFKVALDFGAAYHFGFKNRSARDPYGIVVDRCARLVERGQNGAVLCSLAYRQKLPSEVNYISCGTTVLRGFEEAQEIFLRWPKSVPSADYLKPLIDQLNLFPDSKNLGYKYVSREFSPAFFTYNPTSTARPLLLRDLLNIPKLPFTWPKFIDEIRHVEREQRERFYGYLVEWDGHFQSYKKENDSVRVKLYPNDHDQHSLIDAELILVPSMLDIVERFQKNQFLRFRGVLMNLFIGTHVINYVDLQL